MSLFGSRLVRDLFGVRLLQLIENPLLTRDVTQASPPHFPLTWIAAVGNFDYIGCLMLVVRCLMRRSSLVSLVVICGGLSLFDAPLHAQASGGSALEQGNALVAEIRGFVSDAASRASAAESMQPPQVTVASCLNQIGQTLSSYEATGSTALNSLAAAVDSGDSGTAQSQLSLIILANKAAKTSAASAAACEAGGVANGGTDANGDGVPDDESSTGGISGLDVLEGDDETATGFSPDEFVPDGDSMDEQATSDVVTSPTVTP
jgi:hypothetical protein